MTCTNFFKKCEKRRKIFLFNFLTFFVVLSVINVKIWKSNIPFFGRCVQFIWKFKKLSLSVSYKWSFYYCIYIYNFSFTSLWNKNFIGCFQRVSFVKISKKKKKRKFEMNNKMHRYIVLLIKYKNNILVFIDSE